MELLKSAEVPPKTLMVVCALLQALAEGAPINEVNKINEVKMLK
jgi:hypothetical protein